MEKVKQDHCQIIENSGEGQGLGAIMSGDVEDSKVFSPLHFNWILCRIIGLHHHSWLEMHELKNSSNIDIY